MELKDEIDLANTKALLREVQERYAAARDDTTENERLRRLSMASLKRLINQLNEQITRYESRLHQV
jgi:hypothetical protein